MSIGEYRVRTSFNPAGDSSVDRLKNATAVIIDGLQNIADTGDEAGRCAKIAQTRYEEAAMWAVKALTEGKAEDLSG